MDYRIIQGLYYTETHEWARIDGGRARIGITDYAQKKLGDITYVELPEEGKDIRQSDFLTGIESVKAASDIYAPLSGKITAVNIVLETAPESINQSPYEDGWIAEIEILDSTESENLMDAGSYKDYIQGLE